jgi:hypothetical protein
MSQPNGELLLISYTATCHHASSRVCAVPASQYLWNSLQKVLNLVATVRARVPRRG